jgi:hypothetical protein
LFGVAVTEVDGSYSINERMNEVGVDHCFEIHEGQDHVPSLSNAAYYDTTLSFMSQFLAEQICQYNFNCQYQAIATGLNEVENNVVQVYPNPSNHLMALTGISNAEPIVIYNAQGQWIAQSTAYPGEYLNIEDLQTGIYFLVSPTRSFETITFIRE